MLRRSENIIFRRSFTFCNKFTHIYSRNMGSEQCPILYGDEISPPVRFVMMTASVLGFKIKFHKIDLFKSEHKKDFYKKINPLQKVPALDIGTTILCDSHAIALYLCHKNVNKIHNIIYPADPRKRALINQMLFFNSGTLFNIDSEIFCEYFRGNWPLKIELVNRWYEALDFLETQLIDNKWLNNNQMTLSDLCCGSTVSSVVLLLPLLQRHSRIKCWLENLETLPCFKINKHGITLLQNCLKIK